MFSTLFHFFLLFNAEFQFCYIKIKNFLTKAEGMQLRWVKKALAHLTRRIPRDYITQEVISMIKRICSFSYHVAGIIAASFLAVMMIVLATQVFSRYVLNDSISFAEELIRFLEIWVVFLGASLCVKDDTHPTVTIFANLFPKKTQFFIRIFAHLAVFAVGVVMIVVGYQFAMKYINQLSPTMRISVAWVYAAIPVSGILIDIQSIGNFSNLLNSRKNSTKEENC